jgi:Tfp pilus assembly protein PilZ
MMSFIRQGSFFVNQQALAYCGEAVIILAIQILTMGTLYAIY